MKVSESQVHSKRHPAIDCHPSSQPLILRNQNKLAAHVLVCCLSSFLFRDAEQAISRMACHAKHTSDIDKKMLLSIRLHQHLPFPAVFPRDECHNRVCHQDRGQSMPGLRMPANEGGFGDEWFLERDPRSPDWERESRGLCFKIQNDNRWKNSHQKERNSRMRRQKLHQTKQIANAVPALESQESVS